MSLTKQQAWTLARRLDGWGRAIANEIAEHGSPNTFGVRELAGLYSGLKIQQGYDFSKARTGDLQEVVNSLLRKRGLEEIVLNYAGGRFSVVDV